MFENPGTKHKSWAKFVAWVGIIASVITGIVVISSGAVMSDYMNNYMNSNSMVWPGILIIVGGSLASWIGSLFIYAFGDITEQTAAMRKSMDAQQSASVQKLKIPE